MRRTSSFRSNKKALEEAYKLTSRLARIVEQADLPTPDLAYARYATARLGTIIECWASNSRVPHEADHAAVRSAPTEAA